MLQVENRGCWTPRLEFLTHGTLEADKDLLQSLIPDPSLSLREQQLKQPLHSGSAGPKPVIGQPNKPFSRTVECESGPKPSKLADTPNSRASSSSIGGGSSTNNIDSSKDVDITIPDADAVDDKSVCPAPETEREDIKNYAAKALALEAQLECDTTVEISKSIHQDNFKPTVSTESRSSRPTEKPDLALQTSVDAEGETNEVRQRHSTISPIQNRIGNLGIFSSTPTPSVDQASPFKAVSNADDTQIETTTSDRSHPPQARTVLPENFEESTFTLAHKAVTNLKEQSGIRQKRGATGAIARYKESDHPSGSGSPASTRGSGSDEEEEEDAESKGPFPPWRRKAYPSPQPGISAIDENLDLSMASPTPCSALLPPEKEEEKEKPPKTVDSHLVENMAGPGNQILAQDVMNAATPDSTEYDGDGGDHDNNNKNNNEKADESNTAGGQSGPVEKSEDAVMSNTNEQPATTKLVDEKGTGGDDGGDEKRPIRRLSNHGDDDEDPEVSSKKRKRDSTEDESASKGVKRLESSREDTAVRGLLGIRDFDPPSSSKLPVDPLTASSTYTPSSIATPATMISSIADEALKLESSQIDPIFQHQISPSQQHYDDPEHLLPPINNTQSQSPTSPKSAADQLTRHHPSKSSDPEKPTLPALSSIGILAQAAVEGDNTFIQSHVNVSHNSPEMSARQMSQKERDAYLQKQAQQASSPQPFFTPKSGSGQSPSKESPATLTTGPSPNGSATFPNQFDPAMYDSSMKPPLSLVQQYTGGFYQNANNQIARAGTMSSAATPIDSPYNTSDMTGPSTGDTMGTIDMPGSMKPSPKSRASTKTRPPNLDPALGGGNFKCDFDGCTANPFQTQYLLNSHANVHSEARPHYCPVASCARSEGGKGFKRKNEMIRHGLVHASPGYICPFCPEREHKYPRPDNLQRHVKVHHPEKTKDDAQLREVLNQRPEGGQRGRRRRNAV